ncbi:MAG: Ig-like domain-containing protein [Opitutales bacterium]
MEPSDSAPGFPYTRELRKPYFLLRTADGLGNFFKREIHKALFGRSDPLTRFLAPARLDTVARPPRLEYSLTGIDTSTLQPLDYLSQGELEAFRAAAEVFYEKALPGAERVTPFERELRQSFRLPDPDVEPDAYWTYGPPEDRRLLIVWGCEYQPETSLPLMPAAFASGPTILDRLKARLMPWKGMQERALALLEAGDEPLRQFIGRPRRGPKGDLKSILLGGKTIPLEACKPATYVAPKLVREFDEAAHAFYGRAGADDIPAFERELRLAFRVPHPHACASAWYLTQHKDAAGLIVLLDGDEPREQTVPATAVEEIDFPPAEEDAQGRSVVPENAVELLLQRKQPWIWKAVAGAAVALLLLAAGLRLVFPPDTTAPTFEDVEITPDPRTIEVAFSEPIDPASLVSAEEAAWRAADNRDELAAPIRRFTLRNQQGMVIEIADHAIDPADPSRVVLTVPEMPDDSNYRLEVDGVTDLAGNPLEEGARASFTFRDRTPPHLVEVSGDASDSQVVIMVFDEPLHEPDATRTDNYEIDGFVFREAILDADGRTVYLRATNPFQDRERYELRVRGVSDRSTLRNTIRDWSSQSFVYADTIPPAVEEVAANDDQVTVAVTFREVVEELSAETRGNYIIRGPEGNVVEVRAADLQPDQRRVLLRTEPLEGRTPYTLSVQDVVDAAGNPTDPAVRTEFAFTGEADDTPPFVAATRALGDRRTILVTLNELVDRAQIEDPTNWSIDASNLGIESVTLRRGTDKEYAVRLANPMPEDGQDDYQLTIGTLTDLVGNEVNNATTRRFPPPGIRVLNQVYVNVASILVLDEGAGLEVAFTEPIADGSVAPDNFEISPAVPIVQTSKKPESEDVVILRFAAPLEPGTYQLRARRLALMTRPDLVTRQVPPEVFTIGE